MRKLKIKQREGRQCFRKVHKKVKENARAVPKRTSKSRTSFSRGKKERDTGGKMYHDRRKAIGDRKKNCMTEGVKDRSPSRIYVGGVDDPNLVSKVGIIKNGNRIGWKQEDENSEIGKRKKKKKRKTRKPGFQKRKEPEILLAHKNCHAARGAPGEGAEKKVKVFSEGVLENGLRTSRTTATEKRWTENLLGQRSRNERTNKA